MNSKALLCPSFRNGTINFGYNSPNVGEFGFEAAYTCNKTACADADQPAEHCAEPARYSLAFGRQVNKNVYAKLRADLNGDVLLSVNQKLSSASTLGLALAGNLKKFGEFNGFLGHPFNFGLRFNLDL